MSKVSSERYVSRWAIFSPCGRYRYELGREWGAGRTLALAFFGVNPSTAGANNDDATVRVLMTRAQRAGFARLVIGNPYALISTDPKGLRTHKDPVGPANSGYIRSIISNADAVLVGWGNAGAGERAEEILELCRLNEKPPLAVGLTKAGNPWHPLRKSLDLPMRPLAELQAERTRLRREKRCLDTES